MPMVIPDIVNKNQLTNTTNKTNFKAPTRHPSIHQASNDPTFRRHTERSTRHYCHHPINPSLLPETRTALHRSTEVSCQQGTVPINSRELNIRMGSTMSQIITNPARNSAHLRQLRVNPLVVSKGPWATQEAVGMGTMVLPQCHNSSEVTLDR